MSHVTGSDNRSETRSTIVDVAAQLLREGGPAAVTTRGVAGAAGVQAPTIYRLFGDKDGLLDAVAEHVMETYVSAKSAIVETATSGNVDPLDDLRAGWNMQIDFGVANPTLFALLSDPERALRSPAAQSGRRVLQARVQRIAAAGRLRVREEHAVDLIHAAGTGTILTILATPAQHRDPTLGSSMYEAVLRQILFDAPEPPQGGLMATAVAFRTLAPRLTMLSDAERQLLADWLDRALDAL